MKSPKYLFAFFAFLLTLTISVNAQTLRGTDWQTAKDSKSGTLTIAFYEENAFAYQDETGTHTGVQLDILKQFSNWLKNGQGIELNINYKSYTSFSKLMEDVENGRGGVIGAGNVTITNDRKQRFNFSDPYMNNVAVLVTHQDVPTLASMNEMDDAFEGKRAVVFEGTTHEQTLQEIKNQYYPSLNISYVGSDDEAISTVENSTNYFTYVDLFMYWLASQNNKPIKRHAVGDRATEQFGFILPKDSQWNEPLEEFFKLGGSYRSSSAYRGILMKHLGTEVTQMLQMAARN